DDVKKIVGDLDEPFLHKPLRELDAVKEIKIKPEKRHVSVKVALAKTGSAEQMQLQQEIVIRLKEAGAETVGLRFEELPEEVVMSYQESAK
ncbi:chromosome partitioning protein ParA, partial [Bacillus subtilis]